MALAALAIWLRCGSIAADLLGGAGAPSTIVLDRQGRVAHIWLQAIEDPQQMIDVVGAIAAEQS